MIMTSLVISIALTIVILLLSLLTISKGYDFKHTIDPKPGSDQDLVHDSMLGEEMSLAKDEEKAE